jgi:SAM-dependent methyltransferase
MNLPDPSLPPDVLLREQSIWLAPARSRLFRRISIAHKKAVLDLGAGYGAVTEELARRSSGFVLAVDRSYVSLREINKSDACSSVGDALNIPVANSIIDLVFCQNVLLWISQIERAIREIDRVLQPGGVLVAIEPDFGGLIEYPESIALQPVWLSALRRSGADPLIGRKLPTILNSLGYGVHSQLLDQIISPSPTRFEFLKGLILTPSEEKIVEGKRELAVELKSDEQIAHLPYFLITATKGD